MRSVVVVLPESMWALIPIFLILEISIILPLKKKFDDSFTIIVIFRRLFKGFSLVFLLQDNNCYFERIASARESAVKLLPIATLA